MGRVAEEALVASAPKSLVAAVAAASNIMVRKRRPRECLMGFIVLFHFTKTSHF